MCIGKELEEHEMIDSSFMYSKCRNTHISPPLVSNPPQSSREPLKWPPKASRGASFVSTAANTGRKRGVNELKGAAVCTSALGASRAVRAAATGDRSRKTGTERPANATGSVAHRHRSAARMRRPACSPLLCEPKHSFIFNN